MNTQIIRPPAFQRPSGKLYLGPMQQDLVNTTDTLVLLDQIPDEFTDGIESESQHRITPGRAGFYAISGQVSFVGTVADKAYKAMLKISGAGGYICTNHAHASLSFMCSALCSLPCVYLSAIDYVELWAISFSGDNTVDIEQYEENTFLAIQRVR